MCMMYIIRECSRMWSEKIKADEAEEIFANE
jgi:hypothetical protein